MLLCALSECGYAVLCTLCICMILCSVITVLYMLAAYSVFPPVYLEQGAAPCCFSGHKFQKELNNHCDAELFCQ